METALTTGRANVIGRPVTKRPLEHCLTALSRETPGTRLKQDPEQGCCSEVIDRFSDIQNQRSTAFSALEAECGHG